ncbi:olfactory receptor 6B9-like [Rhinophrynus dorsalis]
MLVDLISKNKSISVRGCITQCYFTFVLGAIENYLLALMAYDRYLAICKPLRYPVVMNSRLCRNLSIGSWICSFSGSLLPIYFLSKLSFCGSNIINNFFCDLFPLLHLSCTNTMLLKLYFLSFTWLIVFSCLVFIIMSYVHILLTVLHVSSRSGRRKAFSTCGSHLTVVIIYYASVIFMYVRPTKRYMFRFDKIVSVFYLVVTPLLNPIIYTLRNKDVKNALRAYVKRNTS